MSALEELFAQVAALWKLRGETPVKQWATVTSISPLKVQLDKDAAPADGTAESLISGLHVGARVWVALYGSRLLVEGKFGGPEPLGQIAAFNATTAPLGWLLCDGSTFSATTYPALAAYLGTNVTPNFKGRTLVGRDPADGTFGSLGNSGGEKYHTLTAGEMPSHAHGQDAHSHTVSLTNIWFNDGGANNIASGSSTRRTTTSYPGTSSAQPAIWSAGGGGSHNNLQPYSVTNFFIRAS